jgi:hypothetical protein
VCHWTASGPDAPSTLPVFRMQSCGSYSRTTPSVQRASLGAQIDSVKADHETGFSPVDQLRGAVSIAKAVPRRTRTPERLGLKRLAEPELGGPVERSRCKSAGLFQPTCAASDRAAGRIGR